MSQFFLKIKLYFVLELKRSPKKIKNKQADFLCKSNAKLTQGQTQRLLKAFDKTA